MDKFCIKDLHTTEQFTFLNCLPLIVWVEDNQGNIVFANQSYFKFFGIEPQSLSFSDKLKQSMPLELQKANLEQVSKELVHTFVVELNQNSNHSQWLEIQIISVINDDNANLGYIYFAYDITEKKEIEKHQNRIRKQLQALNKILTNPIEDIQNDELIRMSVQTIFDFFSEFRISYFSVDHGILTLKQSVEPKEFTAIQEKSKEIKDLISYTSYLQIKGYQFFNNVNEVHSESPSPIFIEYPVYSLLDIPINFEHNVVGIMRIDTEKPHHWLDDEIQAFSEIGKNLSNLLQKNTYRLQMMEYEKNLLESYNQLQKYTTELEELKELYKNRSEELFINRELLEEQAFSINLLNQQLLQKEEEILETNKQLENAIKERDKFFSIIAHDLRGPLSSFLNITKMINEQSNQFTKEELIEISGLIHKNAEILYSLIENLLDWSRLQRNVISIDPQQLNVKIITDSILPLFNDSLFHKQLELINKINKNHFVYCDLNMLNSIIRNLLSNAIKFTPKGGKIFIESYEYNSNYIGISITDTGIGMDDEILSKLFKIDEKVSRPGTEGEPSTGLGLVICKELIERNDGKLNVISSEGVGTKFEILLPKKSIFDDIID